MDPWNNHRRILIRDLHVADGENLPIGPHDDRVSGVVGRAIGARDIAPLGLSPAVQHRRIQLRAHRFVSTRTVGDYFGHLVAHCAGWSARCEQSSHFLRLILVEFLPLTEPLHDRQFIGWSAAFWIGENWAESVSLGVR